MASTPKSVSRKLASRDEAKRLLANGVDPGEVRKAQKQARHDRAANSFETIAREWFEQWKTTKAESHSSKVIARLENDMFPWLGAKPIDSINAPDVLAVLRRIESRGVRETVQRAKENISQVMRFSIATGRQAGSDPCPLLRGALPPVQHRHFAALTELARVGELLRAIDAMNNPAPRGGVSNGNVCLLARRKRRGMYPKRFKGTYPVRAALALAPLVFVQPGELRAARWADIDLDKAKWKHTASKTKTELQVPLSRQAVEILKDLWPLTGQGEYLFPSRDSRQTISNSTLNAALVRMGYDTKEEFTMHGWRACARTLLAEKLHFPPEVIEHQLAHAVPDTLGATYNRTRFLEERRGMMQVWADYLDRLKAGAEMIPLCGTAA